MDFFPLQLFITATNLLMSLAFIDSIYNILYELVLTESKSDASRLYSLKMTNNKSYWMSLCRWHLLTALKNNSKSLNSNLIWKVQMTVDHLAYIWVPFILSYADQPWPWTLKTLKQAGRQARLVDSQGRQSQWGFRARRPPETGEISQRAREKRRWRDNSTEWMKSLKKKRKQRKTETMKEFKDWQSESENMQSKERIRQDTSMGKSIVLSKVRELPAGQESKRDRKRRLEPEDPEYQSMNSNCIL